MKKIIPCEIELISRMDDQAPKGKVGFYVDVILHHIACNTYKILKTYHIKEMNEQISLATPVIATFPIYTISCNNLRLANFVVFGCIDEFVEQWILEKLFIEKEI